MKSNPELVMAFAALTDVQKDNIRFHLQKGTRILCGEHAERYSDGKGGG